MFNQSFARQTHVHGDLIEVWQFFSDPHNLPLITPPDMRFRILNEEMPHRITEGMKIRYRVCPVWNIPVTWESEISAVEAGHYFIDTQTRGPYALWEHTHVFEQYHDGVLMTDHVVYRLPGGLVGLRLTGDLVRHRLERIFDYREHRISSIFNVRNHAYHH